MALLARQRFSTHHNRDRIEAFRRLASRRNAIISGNERKRDVSREVVSGIPSHIPTSYVERQNLTLRVTQKRFARLTNGFSKKLTNDAAAVSLYVAHYNLCRVHKALRTTPAVALGIPDRVWPSETCWTPP